MVQNLSNDILKFSVMIDTDKIKNSNAACELICSLINQNKIEGLEVIGFNGENLDKTQIRKTTSN